MDFGLGLLAMIFALLTGCLFTAAVNYGKENNSGSAAVCVVFGIICLIVSMVLAFGGRELQEKTPIRSTTRPHVDTLITIKNGVADTTYYYNFNNNKNETNE